jgi:hypothetical protein
MSGLGLKEYFAIGLLLVGAVIALAFFTYNDTGGSSGSGLEPTPTLAPNTPVPGTGRGQPQGSPTPLLRDTLQVPSSWAVMPFRIVGETRTKEITIIREELNLEFAVAPFPDFKDGAWGMTAEANVNGTPAIYTFEFETSARVIVTIDDEQVLEDNAPGLRKVKVEYAQRSRSATIRIEALDRPGEPFILRWK